MVPATPAKSLPDRTGQGKAAEEKALHQHYGHCQLFTVLQIEQQVYVPVTSQAEGPRGETVTGQLYDKLSG